MVALREQSISWDGCIKAAIELRNQKDGAQWELGDIANQVVKVPMVGRPSSTDDRVTVTAFAQQSGIDKQSLNVYMRNSAFYHPSMRGYFNLSYSHYDSARRAYPKSLEDAMDWLEQAEKCRWSAVEMVTQIMISKARTADDDLEFSSIIKPMDNWNFDPSRFQWEQQNTTNGYGYIPGEIYANCFWYFVKPGDIAVDPMAGSGMAQQVYDDRAIWMKSYEYEFDLHLFDLSPQQEYIQQHDLLTGFPLEYADYIFMDIPYFRIVKKQYSPDNSHDLANMKLEGFLNALNVISANCCNAQESGGKCTIVSPNYADWKENRVIMITQFVVDAFRDAGYELYHKAYATRRIQRHGDIQMALQNNAAKKHRIMMPDISEVMTFVKR